MTVAERETKTPRTVWNDVLLIAAEADKRPSDGEPPRPPHDDDDFEGQDPWQTPPSGTRNAYAWLGVAMVILMIVAIVVGNVYGGHVGMI